MLRRKSVTISGAGSTVSIGPIQGLLEHIRVAYTNGQATGDLTITDASNGVSILALVNHNTNVNFAVRKQAVDTAGTAITGEYARIPVSGELQIVTAQQAANTVVTVDVWWIE